MEFLKCLILKVQSMSTNLGWKAKNTDRDSATLCFPKPNIHPVVRDF